MVVVEVVVVAVLGIYAGCGDSEFSLKCDEREGRRKD